MDVTGERMIEDGYQDTAAAQAIWLMHEASYAFAVPYCAGRRVLDLGCGSGYGAARIAAVASSVEAVDVSEEAVAYAQRRYPRDNVRYSTIVPDAPLPFADGQFDVVLSFQVIEHVQDDVGYLREAARVLAPRGTLVLITPDRRHRLLPGQRPWNRWHLREYSGDVLARLVEREFAVERALRMDAAPAIAGLELRRYRLLKWVTLPFTLPGMPEAWRRWGLDLLHHFKREGTGAPADPTLGVHDVKFVDSTARSLNLLFVGRKAASGDAGRR